MRNHGIRDAIEKCGAQLPQLPEQRDGDRTGVAEGARLARGTAGIHLLVGQHPPAQAQHDGRSEVRRGGERVTRLASTPCGNQRVANSGLATGR